jgi:PilX N-terminal
VSVVDTQAAPFHPDPRRERGVVLIVALMAMLVMIALGTALILTTSTELAITRNFRNSSEALYAADAVLERAVDDLLTIPDWNTLLSGVARSTFTEGPPSGARALSDGKSLDLGEVLNIANCQKIAACSDADMDRTTAERPWGLNNPRWQPFAWGYLNDITSTGTVNSPCYVVVMVGDDPSENDNNPLADGSAPCALRQTSGCNPGTGVLALRAEAFGPFGAHKVIELTVSRTSKAISGVPQGSKKGVGQEGVRILSWREVR